eukprot:TRINITY_DN51496_c0_g1_i1.p1 TRINITY_DN51496_c0_g1~~TRINITY_DN51496_c0_g1_i1.p1  ORF type:complete len:135 (+),score=18.86 TRINITY_DN51496_c0_g1_i1:330-734(+)
MDKRKKFTVKVPQVVRDGSKKSAFTNFQDFWKTLNRPQDHLLNFILAELGTSGSIDGNNCLILKGRYQPKHIENQLRQYINEYVQCAMCHSLETDLLKDANTRLYQLSCRTCNATRTVQPIQTGYHAQTKRKKK